MGFVDTLRTKFTAIATGVSLLATGVAADWMLAKQVLAKAPQTYLGWTHKPNGGLLFAKIDHLITLEDYERVRIRKHPDGVPYLEMTGRGTFQPFQVIAMLSPADAVDYVRHMTQLFPKNPEKIAEKMGYYNGRVIIVDRHKQFPEELTRDSAITHVAITRGGLMDPRVVTSFQGGAVRDFEGKDSQQMGLAPGVFLQGIALIEALAQATYAGAEVYQAVQLGRALAKSSADSSSSGGAITVNSTNLTEVDLGDDTSGKTDCKDGKGGGKKGVTFPQKKQQGPVFVLRPAGKPDGSPGQKSMHKGTSLSFPKKGDNGCGDSGFSGPGQSKWKSGFGKPGGCKIPVYGCD